MAGTDIFLKVGGNINGESTDDQFKDHLNIESYGWGVTQQGTFSAGSGAGGGAGRSMVQDMHFTKLICKASPELMIACATGKHIPDATLFVRKATGDKAMVYFQFEMKDVLVSSYQTGSGGGQGALINEQFSFNFRELTLTYWQQTAAGGQGAKVQKKYDLATNKGS
jgi:type VI secretion system secreted protein Hcp